MAEIVVFDSSILIDQIRTNRHIDRILKIDGLIRAYRNFALEVW
jgi:hypothetical protein